VGRGGEGRRRRLLLRSTFPQKGRRLTDGWGEGRAGGKEAIVGLVWFVAVRECDLAGRGRGPGVRVRVRAWCPGTPGFGLV
jgi:hypothetical protein